MTLNNYKRLGDYIREVNVRKLDLAVTRLMGININKHFMPSVANTIGTDMSTYKIVDKSQFACNLMHVGRDEKIPIAIQTDNDKIIVSPAYFVFEVIDKTKLLPEYLMMWFSRGEFDRNAWFYTDADVRGGMNNKALLAMTLPIPDIAEQQRIVAEYEALSRRIAINEQICTKLEETAQALYRKMFVDNIDKENVPEGWRMGTIGEYATAKSGFAFKSDWWQEAGIPVIKIGSIQNNSISLSNCDFVDAKIIALAKSYKAQFGDIVIAMTGATLGKIGLVPQINNLFLVNQRVGIFDLGDNPIAKSPFLYFLLQEQYVQNEITTVGGDSAQENVSNSDIENVKIIIPP